MARRTRNAPDRRIQTGAALPPETQLVALIAGVVIGGTVVVWIAGACAGLTVGANPFAFMVRVVLGRAGWTTAATVWLVVWGVLIVGLPGGGWTWWQLRRRRSSRRQQVAASTEAPGGWIGRDHERLVSLQGKEPEVWMGPSPESVARVEAKAASMATAADLAIMRPAGAAQDARRLKSIHAGLGSAIGRLSLTDEALRASWEWVQVWIMGPRAGKTSCVCVRQIVETTGPVVATSNKPDIVLLTRGPRAMLGHTWVFDPQDQIGEPPAFWWNPLTFITAYPDAMVERADQLAELFNSSATTANSTTDAYFDPEGQKYLSSLMLAAAVGEKPITAVWEWMLTPSEPEPVFALELGGFPIAAQSVRTIAALPDEQREGVVGTARKIVSWLRSERVVEWVTPHPSRPHFDVRGFLDTSQTLYLISREGPGSARAVTAALAVAVITAAEHVAGRSPAGRLETPLSVILDEAANVVRWTALPDMYSHFGSRGICVSAFFQSWAQGEAAYGADGMKKLWSASNVRVVGSGIAEEEFLARVMRLVGDHDVVTSSRTVQSGNGKLFGGGSTTRQLHRESIFEVAELAGMPASRAIMLTSGARAALVRLTHWKATDYAGEVAASFEHYSQAYGLDAEGRRI